MGKVNGISGRVLMGAVVGAVLAGVVRRAEGFDYVILHSFTSASQGAISPQASLVLSGTKLYGLTQLGGGNNGGVLFSFDLSGNAYAPLHSFTGLSGEGRVPQGSLLVSGSVLYGMTFGGGTGDKGTIFKFDPSGNALTTVHAFAGAPNDGMTPRAALVQSGSLLYGMTQKYDQSGGGTLFSFDPTTGSDTLLHVFPNIIDSSGPWGSPLISGNIIYGMTHGTDNPHSGTLFSYNLTTATHTVLHTFVGGTNDGDSPFGSVIQSGNKLYGMTQGGGPNSLGTIFSYDLSTNVETVLHSFAGGANDGASPKGSLIQSGDLLYGMTYAGGATDWGTVFSFNVTTGTLNVLHSFDGVDGGRPDGDVLLAGNTLYGLTNFGGTQGLGAMFGLALPEPGTVGILGLGVWGLLRRRRAWGT